MTESVHPYTSEQVLAAVTIKHNSRRSEYMSDRRIKGYHFNINWNEDPLGYCVLRFAKPAQALDLHFFYPLSFIDNWPSINGPLPERSGVATLTHAMLIDGLAKKHNPQSLLIRSCSDDLEAFLAKMDLQHVPGEAFNISEYRTKSLAYASKRGFTPDRWQPINWNGSSHRE